jgi:hypothetical protein
MTATDIRDVLRRWIEAERNGDRDRLDGLVVVIPSAGGDQRIAGIQYSFMAAPAGAA